MVELTQSPPLKPLHLDRSVNEVKFAQMERLSTEVLLFRYRLDRKVV
jgi:hypothetical protein